MAKRRFRIVLIKPSHYDDDGYVIQWRRSTIPSNSLASVYGLMAECTEARVLGPDVDIAFEIYDECNTIVDIPAISQRILADGGMVAMVGVQSNQFPRALDIGRQFRKQGVTVAVGGFHVSGCIAMLPELPPDLKEAQALGIILYAGEGEGRLAGFLKDVDSGQPKPVYNYLNDMPDMAAAAIPVLPREVVTRVAGHYTSFDAGRGCPFQCSFCTIINVQGRKSRYRTPDDVEAIVRANAAQGVTRFFVTDDNFARNRNWEPILDRLIELREQTRLQDQAPAAGRHALPQDPEFHREGGAGRLQRRVHRTREHQSRIADGREEAPEQDLGISRHAAGVAARQGHDLGGLHPRLSHRHARNRSPATSTPSSANCRSTFSNSSSSRRCRDRRTTRSFISRARGWRRT